MEQNYRSTKTIVGAANNVIHNNKQQLHKEVWTDNVEGELISAGDANWMMVAWLGAAARPSAKKPHVTVALARPEIETTHRKARTINRWT